MYTVFVPGYLFSAMFWAKSSGALLVDDFKATHGWLFLRYEVHVCTWYEFVVMARKAGLITAGVFLREVSDWAVVGASLIILGVSLALHVWALPYADHELSHKEEFEDKVRRWTRADKLEGINLSAELLNVGFVSFFMTKPDEDSGLAVLVGSVALIVAGVPVVLGVIAMYLDHRDHARAMKKEKEGETEFHNPVAL